MSSKLESVFAASKIFKGFKIVGLSLSSKDKHKNKKHKKLFIMDERTKVRNIPKDSMIKSTEMITKLVN